MKTYIVELTSEERERVQKVIQKDRERVLEVDKRPDEPRYPVLCLDECPKQLLSETQVPVRLADRMMRGGLSP